MFAIHRPAYTKWAILLMMLVVLSNLLVYRSPLSSFVIPEQNFWLVAGSLFDFSIVIPLLLLLTFRLSAKQWLAVTAGGVIAARFVIPALYFEPFTVLYHFGLGLAALLLAAELAVFLLLIYYAPAIRRSFQQEAASPLFALVPSIPQRFQTNRLIRAAFAEALTVYYAFFTWKKKPVNSPFSVSLHRNTSSIAFTIMLIHCILIETIGIHWWLHEKSAVLSLALLILNIYSVVYFLGDIQATRLNPLTIKNGKMTVSLGLAQRIAVPLESLESVRWGVEPDAQAMKFVAKDFEEFAPQVVIDFDTPQQAVLLFGQTKTVSQIAIKVDDPEKLKKLLDSSCQTGN